MFKKNIYFSILLICTLFSVKAQTVYENPNAKIYSYLNRMAAKGMIEFDDLIQPVSRDKITEALSTITYKKEQLSKIELEELIFYLQEYPISNSLFTSKDTATINFMVKDKNARWRAFNIESKNFVVLFIYNKK